LKYVSSMTTFLILLTGVVATPCEMTAHRPREGK
jgi:hypothetical protein